jgi:periplasmic divalent cation tolerance protein
MARQRENTAMKDAAVLVYTTYPSLVEAEKSGLALVEQGLAACVNILPGMRSIYRWKGAIEAADEVVMIIKTRAALAERVTAAVKAGHSYDTPAVVVLPVTGGNQSFIDWILAETETS